MKISISNIAWEKREDEQIAELLHNFGIQNIDISPSKVWTNPYSLSNKEIDAYRAYWQKKGIGIVALQSLLYNKPQLLIFKDKKTRERTFVYLVKMIVLASRLEAKYVIFGSPKNRQRGRLPLSRAMDIAAPFFSRLGKIAHENGVYFCIEPNSSSVGCDFIQTAAEGVQLVKTVNHPSFRLHLDVAAMTLNGENYEKAIERGFPYLEYFHISEPDLALIGSGKADHYKVAKALARLHYDKYVSVEMGSSMLGDNSSSVGKALEFVTRVYH